MGKEKEFFSKEDLETLRKAIGEAEGKSTGEIVIHLVSKVEKDFTVQGERLFHKLKLDRTQERNGVLILVAPWQRVLRIVADMGFSRLRDGRKLSEGRLRGRVGEGGETDRRGALPLLPLPGEKPQRTLGSDRMGRRSRPGEMKDGWENGLLSPLPRGG